MVIYFILLMLIFGLLFVGIIPGFMPSYTPPPPLPAAPIAAPTSVPSYSSVSGSPSPNANLPCPGVGLNSQCGFWMSPTCSMRIAQGCEMNTPPYNTHGNSDAVDLEPENACGMPVYAPIEGTYESVSLQVPIPGSNAVLGYHFYPKKPGCDAQGYSLIHMREVVVPVGEKRDFKQGDLIGRIGCSGSGSTGFIPCHTHLGVGRPDTGERGYNPFCSSQLSPWLSQRDAACMQGQ